MTSCDVIVVLFELNKQWKTDENVFRAFFFFASGCDSVHVEWLLDMIFILSVLEFRLKLPWYLTLMFSRHLSFFPPFLFSRFLLPLCSQHHSVCLSPSRSTHLLTHAIVTTYNHQTTLKQCPGPIIPLLHSYGRSSALSISFHIFLREGTHRPSLHLVPPLLFK